MWETHAQTTEDRPLEWVGLESGRERGRPRQVVALALVVVLTLGTASLLAPGATAHASFTAKNVYVVSNGGNLQSLTVAPEGDVHYGGLESVPSNVSVEVQVKKNSSSGWETIATRNLTASGREGTQSFTFDTVDVLKQSSLKKRDFMANGDGTNKTTTVDIRVRATMWDAGEGGSEVTTTSADSFDVEVQNEKISASAGGTANTNGN